jgi:nucleoside-triphosphatase THEP1
MPLNREGAKISLKMKIEATSEKGISKDTLDSKVRETLRQIGAKIIEEKTE